MLNAFLTQQNDSHKHQNVICSAQLHLKMCTTAVWFNYCLSCGCEANRKSLRGARAAAGRQWAALCGRKPCGGFCCLSTADSDFPSSQLTVSTGNWILTFDSSDGNEAIVKHCIQFSLIQPQVHWLHIWFEYLIFKFKLYWHTLVLYLYHHAIQLWKWTVTLEYSVTRARALHSRDNETLQRFKSCF